MKTNVICKNSLMKLPVQNLELLKLKQKHTTYILETASYTHFHQVCFELYLHDSIGYMIYLNQ